MEELLPPVVKVGASQKPSVRNRKDPESSFVSTTGVSKEAAPRGPNAGAMSRNAPPARRNDAFRNLLGMETMRCNSSEEKHAQILTPKRIGTEHVDA